MRAASALHPWLRVAAAAIGLAVISLVSDVTSTAQLSGDADRVLVVRSTISRLVNAGTVWAGLAVWSGWLLRRPTAAFGAAIGACLLALGVHYGAGQLLGLFGAGAFVNNAHWFAIAVIVGGPLGLLGSVARRRDLWGVTARLTVPMGAVVEPLYTGAFTSPAFLPWTVRVSGYISGAVLLAAGIAGAIAVLVDARRRHLAGSRRINPHTPNREVPATSTTPASSHTHRGVDVPDER